MRRSNRRTNNPGDERARRREREAAAWGAGMTLETATDTWRRGGVVPPTRVLNLSGNLTPTYADPPHYVQGTWNLGRVTVQAIMDLFSGDTMDCHRVYYYAWTEPLENYADRTWRGQDVVCSSREDRISDPFSRFFVRETIQLAVARLAQEEGGGHKSTWTPSAPRATNPDESMRRREREAQDDPQARMARHADRVRRGLPFVPDRTFPSPLGTRFPRTEHYDFPSGYTFSIASYGSTGGRIHAWPTTGAREGHPLPAPAVTYRILAVDPDRWHYAETPEERRQALSEAAIELRMLIDDALLQAYYETPETMRRFE